MADKVEDLLASAVSSWVSYDLLCKNEGEVHKEIASIVYERYCYMDV